MTTNQTIRTLGAASLGALVVAIAALSVRPTPVSGAPGDTTPAPHTITVSASGKVTVVPDVARINLGITATKTTVKAAREAGAKAMTDIIAALKKLGIADADIQTSNISLYPQYGNGSAPKVTLGSKHDHHPRYSRISGDAVAQEPSRHRPARHPVVDVARRVGRVRI